MLGDNIFSEDLTPYVDAFEGQGGGARLLFSRVGRQDATRYGIAIVSDGRLVTIEEKPSVPKSDLAVTGCYMYDQRVFEVIDQLQKSGRDEYEITDVNNHYVARGEARFDILSGWWSDAGTPISKLRAATLVARGKGVDLDVTSKL
jgi:glucose-1-phosphate thymidylyltransferase